MFSCMFLDGDLVIMYCYILAGNLVQFFLNEQWQFGDQVLLNTC
jgi:hypothetical protein